MVWFWTLILRVKLMYKGIKPKNCIAAGPVRLDLKRNSDVFLGKNVFF